MDAFISQLNCATWIKYYDSHLDGLKWIKYVDKRDTNREKEKGGERQREREMEGRRGGRETYDYQLLLCTPSLSYD